MPTDKTVVSDLSFHILSAPDHPKIWRKLPTSITARAVLRGLIFQSCPGPPKISGPALPPTLRNSRDTCVLASFSCGSPHGRGTCRWLDTERLSFRVAELTAALVSCACKTCRSSSVAASDTWKACECGARIYRGSFFKKKTSRSRNQDSGQASLCRGHARTRSCSWLLTDAVDSGLGDRPREISGPPCRAKLSPSAFGCV
jgi:hypothetical protein